MGHHDVESTCDGINLIPCKMVSRDGVNKANSTKQEIWVFDEQFLCFLVHQKIHEEYKYLLDPKMLSTESMGFWLPERKVWPFATCKNNKATFSNMSGYIPNKSSFLGQKQTFWCSDVSIFVFKLLFFQLSSFQASSIFVFVDRGIGARRHKLSSCHNPISACMASVATVNSQPDFLKPNSPDLTFTLSASNWVLPTHC